MDNPHNYRTEVIREACEGLESSPYGVIEDILEDVLFLGAVALKLRDAVPDPPDWVQERQELILADRDGGCSFVQVVQRIQNLLAANEWVTRFCDAVYPQENNPREKLLEFAGELEALSFSREVQVEFVAHAFLLTEPAWRAQLLINLAAQSRHE